MTLPTISGFTFIRNGVELGYPFIESIKSILPIVEEFVIAVGKSSDNTLELIKALNEPKIRIIETIWNEKMGEKGFVYAQQKMIAQYSCIGDWAFYLEGDEVIHEDDLAKIKEATQIYHNDDDVEALVFDYYHFYGNENTCLDSPAWYRTEARIIKNSIRSYAPDGLYWLVLETNKIGRYPKAAHTHAKIYHYGWARSEDKMNLKVKRIQPYWDKNNTAIHVQKIDYREIDSTTLRLFNGTHPEVIQNWLSKEEGVFKANPDHKLTKREIKHRISRKIEKWFSVDLIKKHYRLMK
jgi:glycosyltransferase involved in cell wall biosynthesis